MIDILLATYNGEKYIGQQIDSIRCQTYGDWQLLIHDDGSSDNTISIVKELSLKDSRIRLIEDGVVHLGVAKNFIHLLQYSTSPFVMFCDQDDVWLPTKVSDQLDAMLECEGCHVNTPIVVHSDLLVVDSDLNLISNSFWKYSNINIQQRDFNFLGVKNIVTGCAMMLNRRAIDCSLPFKPETRMHDAWIVLNVLKSGGQLVSMETPTIKYRQHDNNVVGAVVKGNIFRNKILKICTVIKENREQWKMLKIIGYGSLFKYFYFKLRSCINT